MYSLVQNNTRYVQKAFNTRVYQVPSYIEKAYILYCVLLKGKVRVLGSLLC